MTWDGRFRYDPSRGLSVLNTSQESSPSLQFSVGWVTEKAMDSGLDGLDAKIWQRMCDRTAKLKLKIKLNGHHLNTSGTFGLTV